MPSLLRITLQQQENKAAFKELSDFHFHYRVISFFLKQTNQFINLV